MTTTAPAATASVSRARATRHAVRVAWTQLLLLAAVALGLALRIREFAAGRSLWADEVGVAADFEHGSYGSLRHVLPNGQAAPLGWLWAEKVVGSWFGYSDYGVRVVPFVASLASVVLFAHVARRLVGPVAAPVAVLVFATAPRLVYYTSETKQYGSDIALTLVAVAVTIRVWDRPSRRRAIGWGAATSVIVWCSQPGLVVVVTCGCLLAARWARDRRTVGLALTAAALPAVMIASDYVLQLREQRQAPLFQAAWRAGYPPQPQTLSGTVRWIPGDLAAVAHDPGRVGLPALLLVAMVAGLLVAGWPRAGRWGVVILLAPLAVAISMAVLRLYPLRERLALYLFAPAVIVACAGVGAVGRGRAPATRAAALALAVAALTVDGVLFAPSVRAGAAVLAHPLDHSSGRQQLERIAHDYRPGDQIYVEFPWAGAVYGYYAPRFPQLPAPTGFSFAPRPGPCDDAVTLARLRPGTRVWVYFDQHDVPGGFLNPNAVPPPDSARYYLSYFLSRGRLLQRYHRPRADGELDLVAIGGQGPPPAPSFVPGACFVFS